MTASDPDDDDDEKSLLLDAGMVASYANVHQACAIYRIAERFRGVLGPEWNVRVRTPIVVGQFIIPDAAIQIVRARADSYRYHHPTVEDIILLIELVSGLEEVNQDRSEVYQDSQVAQVWTIDLDNSLIEVVDNLQQVTTLHCVPDRILMPGTAFSFAVKDLIP